MQKITPFLWFQDRAEEAVKLYTSLLPDSKIESVTPLTPPPDAPRPEGGVVVIAFRLAGQEFMALNGGPVPGFTFSPAVSLFVKCETQEEVDRLWEKLSEGGEPGDCGWLTDRFGVTWQIVPTVLGEMLSDKDPERVKRVTEAMLQMKKLDIAGLKQAYEQL